MPRKYISVKNNHQKKRFQFYLFLQILRFYLERNYFLKKKKIEGKTSEARAHVLLRLLDRTYTLNRGLSHTRYGRLMNGICTRSHVTE